MGSQRIRHDWANFTSLHYTGNSQNSFHRVVMYEDYCIGHRNCHKNTWVNVPARTKTIKRNVIFISGIIFSHRNHEEKNRRLCWFWNYLKTCYFYRSGDEALMFFSKRHCARFPEAQTLLILEGSWTLLFLWMEKRRYELLCFHTWHLKCPSLS